MSEATSFLTAITALHSGGPVRVQVAQERERKGIDPVHGSAELARILTLPRRSPDALAAVIAAVSQAVSRPGGSMRLRPEQAQALAEAQLARGLFAPLAVGKGKTLLAALLPTVLGVGPSIILTSAGLVAQGTELMRSYSEHFYIRNDIRWLSYSILSSPKQFEILDRIHPRIIIADEAQSLASADAARAKRFRAFMRAHPETIFCAMSGTITKRSIKDFAHLLALALGDRTPLPRDWATLESWAEAVDVSDRPRPPGALVELLTDAHAAEWLHTKAPAALAHGRAYLRGVAQRSPDPDSEEGRSILELARECVRRRMIESIGVVASSSNDLDARLVIEVVPAPICPKIEETLAGVLRRWERPDGELLTYGLEIARVTKHVRLGGYYRWVWPAALLEERADALAANAGGKARRIPLIDQWLAARKAYRAELRSYLQHGSQAGRDSPFLVENAIRRGDLVFDHWDAWDEIRQRVELPPTEWVWISSAIVDHVVDVLRGPVPTTTGGGSDAAGADARASLAPEPLIVWSDTLAVGQEISRRSGLPWYGAGKDAQERILREDGSRSIVASIKAHGIGRNLQCFSRSLVVGGPPSGAIWEQLLGRLHRPGQQAEVVCFSVFASFLAEIKSARRDAQYIRDTTGNAQKLITAEMVGADLEDTS